ncbi:MAG: hypothetical protein IPH95_20120 [Candidatus Promineofilum sp.]|nr:hypothetical protein [Promineifilum sp.]
MTNLTHQQARETIQQAYLPEDEREALRQHLADCAECRAYAAMHVRLHQQLPVAGRARPTPAQRNAILDAAGRKSLVNNPLRPLVSLAGLAALALLIAAAWFVMRPGPSTATQPLPAPLQTALAPFRPAPTPTAAPDPRGRFVIESVPAPSLAGNTIGEPPAQRAAVYLPPSYDSSDRRYPVVYVLTYAPEGNTNDVEALGVAARSAMNLALRGGLAQEMIIVAPDSINALDVPTFFVPSPVTGDWESYLANDLVSYIDANYRTLPSAQSRALLGEVCNGLPALWAAMHRPDVFSAVYLARPLLFAQSVLDEGRYVSPIARSGVNDLLGEVAARAPEAALSHMQERLTGSGVPPVAQETVAYGIAFAPTADGAAPYFDYLYHDADGPADPAVLRRWEDGLGNVMSRLQPGVATLAGLSITVSRTGAAQDTGPAYLSEQLTAAGVPHRLVVLENESFLEEFGQEALPFLSEALAHE